MCQLAISVTDITRWTAGPCHIAAARAGAVAMKGLHMNTNNDHHMLDDSQLDTVTGGSIVSDVVNAAAAVARVIGGFLGGLGQPTFPIKIDLSGATKAGAQLGHIH